MGDWGWASITSWLYPCKTEERLPQWTTHHLLCRFTVSSDAQYPGSADLPAHSSGMPQNHFATGDVYHLLSILRSAPTHSDLILVNQDLAGFFTSIDQDRFVRSWFMLLDFLRPKMNVANNEVFSVYPGKTNNPGDIIKGRTFRRLNVTRKILIQDVPGLIKSALDM